MLATSTPAWLLIVVACIGAAASAVSSIANLIMAVVNWRKLEQMHTTIRTGLARAGLAAPEQRDGG